MSSGNFIDLRSDTLTMPSPAMRRAIAEADLGDDVFQEDPTVNELEKKAAEITGKEAALLVPSGTMANLAAVLSHCDRGTEVLLGDRSHTFIYEAGGISAVGGIHSHQLPNNDDGTIDLERISRGIRQENVHFPETRLICLENTHNICSGSPLPLDYLESVSNLAREAQLMIHVDGARIFNASVALDTTVAALAAPADSISFCMSKGLAAPVGSLLCGTEPFIYKARRIRKVLGGGMRQAGIIAAAGLVALEEMVPGQLLQDHKLAAVLAAGLSTIPGLSCNLNLVRTNLVFFETTYPHVSPSTVVKIAESEGLRFLASGENRFRMVTHYGVDAADIDRAVEIMVYVMRTISRA